MPRPAKPIPTEPLFLRLPIDLVVQLRASLYSELEGRVPYGAMPAFVERVIRDRIKSTSLDLAPFTGAMPGTHSVAGSPESIEALLRALKGEVPL